MREFVEGEALGDVEGDKERELLSCEEGDGIGELAFGDCDGDGEGDRVIDGGAGGENTV